MILDVSPQVMPAKLPNETDFDPYHGDLDAQCAWRHFGGLTLEEALARFEECPETYQEDFMFMGGKAFAFYFPVIDRFLRRTIELPEDQRGDRQSWILPQCVKNQFEGREFRHVQHLRHSVLSLCDFMLKNFDLFAGDWSDAKEIQTQWNQLKLAVEHNV
ncbi:MAG: hypothetical protein KDA91_12550 [Planctomycetaceae bacterium]|nr:hypothetical protein [Planctomycetaceae bacterium]